MRNKWRPIDHQNKYSSYLFTCACIQFIKLDHIPIQQLHIIAEIQLQMQKYIRIIIYLINVPQKQQLLPIPQSLRLTLSPSFSKYTVKKVPPKLSSGKIDEQKSTFYRNFQKFLKSQEDRYPINLSLFNQLLTNYFRLIDKYFNFINRDRRYKLTFFFSQMKVDGCIIWKKVIVYQSSNPDLVLFQSDLPKYLELSENNCRVKAERMASQLEINNFQIKTNNFQRSLVIKKFK